MFSLFWFLKEKLATRVFHLFVVRCKGKIFLTLFGDHTLKKKFQSPLGACLKKLISDPEVWLVITKNTDNLVNPCGLRQICAADVMQWKKLHNCSWFNFWSDGKHVQIAKCTYAKLKQKHNEFLNTQGKTLCLLHFWCFIYKKILSVWQGNCHNALSHTFLCMFEVRVFLWHGLDVEKVNVSVIGGHSGIMILPLLSQVGY